jgi:hypothetical protein
MSSEIDPQRQILSVASLSGVTIAPEDLPAVTGVFSNLSKVAAPLLAARLPEYLVSAPVYTAFEVEAK